MPPTKPGQLGALQLKDLQRSLHDCERQCRLRHELRRECLRRAAAWGRLANYAGAAILGCLALMMLHQYLH